MSAILDVLALPFALVLLVFACAEAYRATRRREAGRAITAGVFACIAFAVLGLLGMLAPLTAGFLAAFSAAAVSGIALKKGRRGFVREITGATGGGFGRLRADSRGLWARILIRSTGLGRDGEESAGPDLPAVAEAVAGRAIPPLAADPALGALAEPAAVATIAPVPAPYAALAAWIAGCEPADDQELRMFMEANAAGGVAVADAWHGFAEHCLSSAGLHPAYVAGILEVGDREAESGSWKVHAHRRFAVIYGAVKEWIGVNGPLPKPPDFLTGEDAA
jgi:hypothetical protein